MSSHPIDKISPTGIKALSMIVIGGILTLLLYWVGARLANDIQFVVLLVTITTGAILWITVSGLSARRAVAIALLLLVLAPAVQLTDSLPIKLPVTTIYDIFILFIGGVFILRSMSGHGKRLITPGKKFLYVLILLIPVTLLSMAWGSIVLLIPLSKGDWFEMVRFFLYISAFYLASQAILKKGSLHFLSKLLVFSLAISTFFGLAQTLDILDFQDLGSAYYAAPRIITSGGMEKHLSVVETRSASTVLNPNEFGLLLAVGLSVSIGLAVGTKSRGLSRIILLGLILLLIIGIVSTGSRTAMVATVALIMYYTTSLLMPRLSRIPRKVRRNFILRGTITVLVIVSSLSFILISGPSLPLVGTTIENRVYRFSQGIDWESDVSVQTRLSNLSLIPIQLKRSPILGDGPSEGASAESVRVLGSGVADSEWILIMLRNGLLGIILYIAFWITAFRLALHTIRSTILEVSIFGHSTLGLLIINLAGSITAISLFDLRRMTITCLMLGLCVAATRLSKSNQLKSRSLRDV